MSDSNTDQIVQKEKKTNFISDFLTIVGGTTISQVIPILLAPLITRIFDPAAFGLIGIVNSISSIISVVACLSYETTIMLPKRDDEAANLFVVSIILAGIISSATTVFFYLGMDPISNLLKIPDLKNIFFFIPIMVFLNALVLILSFWMMRGKRFGSLSISRIVSTVTTSGSQIGLGVTGFATGVGLIISSIFGKIVIIIILLPQIWKEYKIIFLGQVRFSRMLALMRRYREFPQFGLGADFVSILCTQAPILLLALFFSPTVVGYYSLGFMFIQLPFSFISGAIYQVFFQRAAEAKHTSIEAISSLVKAIEIRLWILGLAPFVIMALIGEEVFSFFFGETWGEAGIYVQLLAFWLFFFYITDPLKTLITIFEKMRFMLLYNAIKIFFYCIGLVIGGYLLNPRLAILLLSVFGGLIYVIFFIWLMSLVHVSIKDIIFNIKDFLLLCIPIALIIAGIKWWLHCSDLIIIVVSSILLFLYYCYFIRKDAEVRAQIYIIIDPILAKFPNIFK